MTKLLSDYENFTNYNCYPSDVDSYSFENWASQDAQTLSSKDEPCPLDVESFLISNSKTSASSKFRLPLVNESVYSL